MEYIALILVAVSLAMDAFAVSVCYGIGIKNARTYHAAIFGLTFGGFQFLMPLIGYFLGASFIEFVTNVAHWIAFVLLAFIGTKMILDTLGVEKKETLVADGQIISFRKLFALGIATSIDALAVGISISVAGWNVWLSAIVIGVVAFIFSFTGVLAGKMLGNRYQKSASRVGGLILIGLGIKILIENLIVNG